MNNGRIFAIPDIHARKDLLDLLLNHLNSIQCLDLTQDKLIFLGDYIDRGPDSKGVIEIIKDLTEKHPDNVIALRGNHEDMGLDACLQGNLDKQYLWMMNGGDTTSKSYSEHLKFPYMDPEHIRWMSKLPYYHIEPGFFFSHAPILNARVGTELQTGDYTWTYIDSFDEGRTSAKFPGKVGVCGHIHRLREGFQTEPRMYDHYIFADSGCGCSPKAPLTCVEVISREVITIWPPEALETKVIV